MTQTVLVVDDDPHIREVVGFAMEKAGFKVIRASNGRECVKVFDAERPDALVLDVEMPEMNGTDALKEIRSRSDVPVVFLTCRDEEIDRVLGLELGGDDYVVKPFSTRELVARVKAVLRRTNRAPAQDEPGGVVSRGDLLIDLDKRRVYWKSGEIALSATEFGVLRVMAGHPGKVYSREELMDRVEVNSERAVDSHVKRIRRKFESLGADVIETVHGFGYRLRVE